MKRLNAEPSLREAVARVVAALDGPITRAVLAERVRDERPSHSPHADAQILGEVRRHTDLVRLDDGSLAPPQWVLRGVRFRVTPAPADAVAGIVPLFPAFVPFLLEPDTRQSLSVPHALLTLRDSETGEPVRWDTFDLHGTLHDDNMGADSAVRFQAIVLRDWMAAHAFAPGDSLLLTVEDPARAVFRIAHEPASQADRAAIAIQDATLEAVLVALVGRRQGDQVFLEEVLPAAFARLHDAARAYPGSHWHDVVKRSSGLRLVDDYAIARATYMRPIDRLIGYEASPAARRRLETRIDDCCAQVRRVLGSLPGASPSAAHVPLGRDQALRQSAAQITHFLGSETGGDRQRCLAVPAVYLARHEGVSLADASLPMLCRFMLSYYPRRVLFNRKAFTTRMLSALRHFYAVQDMTLYPQAAGLPRALSRLHALADRKVALLAEIDQEGPDSARLFARLFPDADKDDAEMLTLSFVEPPAQN